MLRDKVRVYELARELNMQSKDLLDMCRNAGYDVKNQLSSLEPDQRDAIEALVKKGSRGGVAVAPPPPQPLPTDIHQRVRVLPQTRTKKPEELAVPPPTVVPVPPPVSTAPPPPPPPSRPAAGPPEPPQAAPAAVAPVEHSPAPAPVPPPTPLPPRPAELAASAPPIQPAPRVPDLTPKLPNIGAAKVPSLSPRPDNAPKPRRDRQLRPAMVRIATPPPLKPALGKVEAKKEEPRQKPIVRLPGSAHQSKLTPQEQLRIVQGTPATAFDAPEVTEEIEDDGKGGSKRPGALHGRDKRHQDRNQRAEQRKARAEAEVVRGGKLVQEDAEERARRLIRKKKREHRPPTLPRAGKVPIELPITVRSLSEAIGIKVGDLLFKLRDHGAPPTMTINSGLDATLAEVIAGEAGFEIEIKRPPDAEAELLEALQAPSDPEQMVPRAPVVTVMGHVDHGKTSLLDKIRKSNVVATEAGGITQVIRAWRVDHGGHPITFLDTPGHEAFTKMRARGAQVTDIAVIVVAADDGVMPQTEEAINHARAAKVPIVVAINKVDLPNSNLNKTRQQLYGLGVLPDDMGGDSPFVETSAATGKGIDELLDSLSLVAETMLVLKADPSKPASGTCLEAMLSEGEGVQATLLVRNGTLRRGDIIVCGTANGRVRAMYDDLGRPIQEAGPSLPVRITGLDEVPNADDPFVVVSELTQAHDIADRRKTKHREASQEKRTPITLEKLSEAKVPELKIVIKADFRGSIEAIKKELEKLKHDEVRINLLHTAIGGIAESDVQLALASPEDTIIVGFNVVPDDRAKALAEDRGIEIREYDIIYKLTDDIRQALEGKLKPHEEVVHLGRASVRQAFKISRVGTVAGCLVTQGVIERSAKIRLIRQGAIVYPPPDRTASLESLKRHKDDVREVREGYDCGLKIAGYDDIKVDDVIEAYRIEQVQRTL